MWAQYICSWDITLVIMSSANFGNRLLLVQNLIILVIISTWLYGILSHYIIVNKDLPNTSLYASSSNQLVKFSLFLNTYPLNLFITSTLFFLIVMVMCLNYKLVNSINTLIESLFTILLAYLWFFTKTRYDYDVLDYNFLLTNKINLLHPPLLYYLITLFLVFYYFDQSKIIILIYKFFKNNSPWLYITLALGCWWAGQEDFWNSWWGFDVSEYFNLYMILISLNFTHWRLDQKRYNILYINTKMNIDNFFIFYSTVYLLLSSSNHSFSSNNDFILILTITCLFETIILKGKQLINSSYFTPNFVTRVNLLTGAGLLIFHLTLVLFILNLYNLTTIQIIRLSVIISFISVNVICFCLLPQIINDFNFINYIKTTYTLKKIKNLHIIIGFLAFLVIWDYFFTKTIIQLSINYASSCVDYIITSQILNSKILHLKKVPISLLIIFINNVGDVLLYFALVLILLKNYLGTINSKLVIFY